MRVQSVFQSGNSVSVAIPKYLAEELDMGVGKKVTVEKYIEGNGVVIKKVATEKPKTGTVRKDFKKWVGQFLEEDADILDELAIR